MCLVMHCLSVGGFQADAVFTSGLQRGDEPSAGQVRRAVAAAIRAFGYSGCAERVAQEFGDHPETAAARMRWARTVTDQVFRTDGGLAGPEASAARVPRPGRLLARHPVTVGARAA